MLVFFVDVTTATWSAGKTRLTCGLAGVPVQEGGDEVVGYVACSSVAGPGMSVSQAVLF